MICWCRVLDGFSTEIRTFYSLKEIREIVEAGISQYKSLLEDYSQWLGSLLRNLEPSKNQEKTKAIAELQKILKAGRTNKKEEVKAGFSTEWTQFRDVMLCAEVLGEAEILFEAIEELKNKINKLEKVKNSLIDLERYGLGKELLYIAFIREGVPGKIVFKPRKAVGATEKFEFTADFLVTKENW
ncbi:MAG: hypothetical protein QXI91_05050 [Candidatus Bathyarchaeia archaeon]